MFDGVMKFFNKMRKKDTEKTSSKTKNAAKERLHLVLMQDRANVSADFMELMKQEIIDVIKKYIDVDEKEIDVKLTNKPNSDGTMGAPILYANIPIVSIKNESRIAAAEKGKEETTEKEEETPETIAETVEEVISQVEAVSEEEKQNVVGEEKQEVKGEEKKGEEKIEETEKTEATTKKA